MLLLRVVELGKQTGVDAGTLSGGCNVPIDSVRVLLTCRKKDEVWTVGRRSDLWEAASFEIATVARTTFQSRRKKQHHAECRAFSNDNQDGSLFDPFGGDDKRLVNTFRNAETLTLGHYKAEVERYC